MDCSFKGLDVLPLVSPQSSEPAAAPQRLRLNGRARFAGRLEPSEEPPQEAEAAGMQSGAVAGGAAEAPSVFRGMCTTQIAITWCRIKHPCPGWHKPKGSHPTACGTSGTADHL